MVAAFEKNTFPQQSKSLGARSDNWRISLLLAPIALFNGFVSIGVDYGNVDLFQIHPKDHNPLHSV
jgi:hypothetical protein